MLKARCLSTTVVVAIACFTILWLTNNLALKKIENNKIKHETAPLLSLIHYPEKTVLSWKNGVVALCGNRYLVKIKESGYGGELILIVARDNSVAKDFIVTQHDEHPKIASFISDSTHTWRRKINEKTSEELGKIDIVSGATITSRSIILALKRALKKQLPPGEC
ncbi:MAG: hypothetical protein CMD74_03355 [Gammaproteobacteria bacterium]|nr:hypothetical protein [Gammaproteobacteria bacterium]